jgi:hypothetical protein
MEEQLLEVHVTTTKTFLVVCPHCNRSREFNLNELQPDWPNPFKFECPCGTPSRVLLNFRKTYRKNVKLAGKFTLSSGTSKVEGNCLVPDISKTGMRIRLVSSQTILKDQLIDVRFALDDKSQTELDVRGTVRRITSDQGRLMLGLEFGPLNAYQQETLGFYLMS